MSNNRPLSSFIIFFGFVSIFMTAVCFFIANFFRLSFLWSWGQTLVATLVICAGTLSYFLGEYISQKKGNFILKYLSAVVMGWTCIAVGIATLGYILRLFSLSGPKMGLILFIVSIILTAIAVINERLSAKPKIIELFIKNQSLEGRPLRVVQLTDIHLNGIKPLSWIKGMVDATNALEPDVIVFTGDLIDTQKQYIQGHIDELKKLKATHKLATSGNHDFYSGYQQFADIIDEMGFVLLDHDTYEVSDDSLKEPVYFVGLPDETHHLDGTTYLQNIIKDTKKTTVLLRHQPVDFEKSADLGVNLQLSGHTHNGQLPPFNFIVRLRYKYIYGLYRYNDSYIYTSKGSSTWGPPMRLFDRSEITCFELQ